MKLTKPFLVAGLMLALAPIAFIGCSRGGGDEDASGGTGGDASGGDGGETTGGKGGSASGGSGGTASGGSGAAGGSRGASGGAGGAAGGGGGMNAGGSGGMNAGGSSGMNAGGSGGTNAGGAGGMNAGGGAAQGTLYNIDFKANYPTYGGKGILGTVPDSKWNGLSNINVANVPLLNSRGVAETAAVSTSGFGGTFGLRFSYAWGDFADYWYFNSTTTPVIVFKNLTPGQTYELVLYCYAGSDKEVTQASVNGGPSKATAGVRNAIQWKESPDPQSNYMRFTGQVPNDGTLKITLSTPSGSTIQGLQLQVGTTAVPLGTRTYKLVPDLAAGHNLKVMFIGTSLTDLPFGVSWPSEMYSALFPKYQGHVILSNRAISGSNSASAVANVERWLSLDMPDVVFIEYAINDAVSNSNISVAKMKSNLDFISAKILANNPRAQIILLTMNNPVGGALTDRPNIELYYQGYRDYAAEKGYLLVDNYPLWKNLYDTNPALWS